MLASIILTYYSNNVNIFTLGDWTLCLRKSRKAYTKVQVLDLKTQFVFPQKTLLSAGAGHWYLTFV